MTVPRLVLIYASGEEGVVLRNSDVHNLLTALATSHAAAGGTPTEFEALRRRIMDEFQEVLR